MANRKWVFILLFWAVQAVANPRVEILNILATWDGQRELRFLSYEMVSNLRVKKTIVTSRDIESLTWSQVYTGGATIPLLKRKH